MTAPPPLLARHCHHGQGEFDPGDVLSRIECAGVRDVVRSMIARDPSDRPALADILQQHTGRGEGRWRGNARVLVLW